MGSIYQRGNTWHIKYYRNGKSYRESTHSVKKSAAERLLKLREGQIQEGTFRGLAVEKTTFDEIVQDVIIDYQMNGKKSLRRAELSLSNLKEYFGGWKAKNITTAHIKTYIVKRQEEKAKNASINRELSFLKRAFSLATKQTPAKVSTKPYIPMLRESNARAGFFEHEQYIALRDVLPDYVKPIFTMGYYTGMRLNEITSLEWSQVNLSEGKVTLNPGTTKNDEARVIFLSGELLDAIKKQKVIRDKLYPSCQWVFFKFVLSKKAKTKESPNTQNGKQIKRFTRSWKTACKTAKLEGMLFHDCRRTAVRNMVNSMIPEKVCMKITGHKTRSVFDRYHIINEDDLKRASSILSERLQNKEEELSRAQNGHSPINNVVNFWR